MTSMLGTFVEAILWTALAAYGTYHFYIVATKAVDIPRADEWQSLDGLASQQTFSWIFSRHGQHRQLFTNLATWIQYHVDGWNIAHQQAVNFIIFLCIFPLLALMGRGQPGGRPWLLPAFLLFLLTPVAYENHSWGFQSCIDFVVLFMIVAVYAGFSRFERTKQSWHWLGVFVSSVAACVYSFASGVGSGTVLAAGFLGLCWLRTGRLRSLRLRYWLALAAIGAAIGAWFVGSSPRPSGDFALYMKFFLNSVSLGHGLGESLSLWPGISIVVAYVVAVLTLSMRPEMRASNEVIAWAVLGAATFAGLLIITLGRAADYGGEFHQSKFSRYAEISFLLIPVIAMLWWNVLAGRPVLRVVALSLYWLVCLAGYKYDRDDLDFINYQHVRSGRLEMEECIAKYYAGGGDALCPLSDIHPIKERLEKARALNLSFYRRLSQAQGAPPR